MTDEQREQLRIELDQEAERAALRIRENFRATQPQPCTRFWNAGTVEWIAKLSEETNEVIQEAKKVYGLEKADEDGVEYAGCIEDAEVTLAEELTVSRSASHGFMRSATTSICAARCRSA